MADRPSGTWAGDVVRKPDSTAVTTALWRAAHIRLDAPPHVLEDEIGLRLVRDTDVLAAYLGPEAAPGPDAWLSIRIWVRGSVAGAPVLSPGRALSRTLWPSRSTAGATSM